MFCTIFSDPAEVNIDFVSHQISTVLAKICHCCWPFIPATKWNTGKVYLVPLGWWWGTIFKRYLRFGQLGSWNQSRVRYFGEKIRNPGVIWVPPSVSLSLVVFGETDPGLLFVLRTAQDVALPLAGVGGKMLHVLPQPPFSLTLPYHRLGLLFGALKGRVGNKRWLWLYCSYRI